MEVTVRVGGVNDRAFVLDLGRRTIESTASALRSAHRIALEENYERLLEFVFSRSHVALIAESSMERVGFLLLLDEMPDEVSGALQAFIAYMAVEPHARRCGAAKGLLDKAESIARERNLPALALMATEENMAARQLYAQAGFVTERRLLVKEV